jgi:metallo-beta-lactamase class B
VAKFVKNWSCILGLVLGATGLLRGQNCSQCAEWNKPQTPFRIYGNTYYVGPHGLSSVLITGPEGDVLIDGDLAESAAVIAGNIRALGFKVEDVKLILNSHVHSDHAGGLAALQRMSGARVLASAASGAVLKNGRPGRDDPQFGELRAIAPVHRLGVVRDGETVRVGPIALTAHLTPGHTPGGTSWTWRTCEGGRCEQMVYADSVTAVSATRYKFSQHPEVQAQFARSFAWLDAVPCDVLITPHPDASDFWERTDVGRREPVVDAGGCRKLAEEGREGLKRRLGEERGR